MVLDIPTRIYVYNIYTYACIYIEIYIICKFYIDGAY